MRVKPQMERTSPRGAGPVGCPVKDGSRWPSGGNMDGRYLIAEGSYRDGIRWVIWARRDEPRQDDLLSMIRVTDAGGRILHAGAVSGPPLYPGPVLNVSTSG